MHHISCISPHKSCLYLKINSQVRTLPWERTDGRTWGNQYTPYNFVAGVITISQCPFSDAIDNGDLSQVSRKLTSATELSKHLTTSTCPCFIATNYGDYHTITFIDISFIPQQYSHDTQSTSDTHYQQWCIRFIKIKVRRCTTVDTLLVYVFKYQFHHI